MLYQNIRLPGGGIISTVPETLDADDVTLVPLMLRIDDPIDALVDSLVMIVLKVLRKDVSQLPLR